MIKKRLYLIPILVMTFSFSYGQSNQTLTEYERSCIGLFNNLKADIKLKMEQVRFNTEKQRLGGGRKGSSTTNHSNIDSVDFRRMIDLYFVTFFDSSDDTNSAARTKKMLIEFNNFFSFFVGKEIDQISTTPLRLCKDKYIYDRLTPFQKKNTFAVIDSKFPDKVFAYLLFVPTNFAKADTPRIMSWTLGYTLGVYYFEDMLGKKGMEFLFEEKSGAEKRIQGY